MICFRLLLIYVETCFFFMAAHDCIISYQQYLTLFIIIPRLVCGMDTQQHRAKVELPYVLIRESQWISLVETLSFPVFQHQPYRPDLL